MDIYKNLKEHGVTLVPGPAPLGLYHTAQTFCDGKLLYTSGTGCRKDGAPIYKGKVGAEVSLEQGQEAARQCIINIFCNLETMLGDLNRIKRVVKVLGFVACDKSFFDQPKVINGASQFLKDVMGEDGVGARSAIGVYNLPGDIPVEIEVIFELR